MISFSLFLRSVRHAVRGLAHIWRAEQNIRIQAVFGFCSIVASIILDVSRFEFLLVIFMIGIVMLLEVLNTIFEQLTDFFSPRHSIQARIIKDMMAAAVVMASVVAAVIGLMIFIPAIRNVL